SDARYRFALSTPFSIEMHTPLTKELEQHEIERANPEFLRAAVIPRNDKPGAFDALHILERAARLAARETNRETFGRRVAQSVRPLRSEIRSAFRQRLGRAIDRDSQRVRSHLTSKLRWQIRRQERDACVVGSPKHQFVCRDARYRDERIDRRRSQDDVLNI